MCGNEAVLWSRSIKSIVGVVRAAKLKTGRNSRFITRPLNKPYPLEAAIICSNRHQCEYNNFDDLEPTRPKREAAVISNLKMKFGGLCRLSR